MKFKLNPAIRRRLPSIFSGIAGAGVVFTAVSASRDTIKALDKESTIDKAKCYAPTAVIAFSTIACIFGSDAMNRRRQASLISAYAMLSSKYRQYQKKVIEHCGEDVHKQIVDEIKVEKANPEDIWIPGIDGYSAVVPSNLGDPEVERTFYEARSKRYFTSKLSKVIEAEYYINHDMALGREFTPNEWYEMIGLSRIENDEEDELVWSFGDEYYWLDFDNRLITLDDGMEVIVISAMFEPVHPD